MAIAAMLLVAGAMGQELAVGPPTDPLTAVWALRPSEARGDVSIVWADARTPFTFRDDSDSVMRLSFPLLQQLADGELVAFGHTNDGRHVTRLESVTLVAGESTHLLVKTADLDNFDAVRVAFLPSPDQVEKGGSFARASSLFIFADKRSSRRDIRSYLEPHEQGKEAAKANNTVLTCGTEECTVTYRWVIDGQVIKDTETVPEGTVIVVPPASGAVVTCIGCD